MQGWDFDPTEEADGASDGGSRYEPSVASAVSNGSIESGEGSDGEDTEFDVPQPSEFSRELVRASLRINGCGCDESHGGRTIAAQHDGYSLARIARHWGQDLQVPDILRIVSEGKKMPRFSPHACSEAPWASILAGQVPGSAEPVGRGQADAAPMARVQLSLPASDERAGIDGQLYRSYDIDAIYLPLKSLAAHKLGFNVVYSPGYMRTIAKGWHTRLGPLKIEPHKCAHVYLGRGFTTADFRTYVFFPHLRGRAGRRTQRQERQPLTRAQQRFWVEEVLVPAVRSTWDQRVCQRHPSSFDEAEGWARARQKESVTSKARAFSELSFSLPSQSALTPMQHGVSALHRLREEVERRLAESPPEWGDAQLVAFTYGCKDVYSADTYSNLRESLWEALESRFDVSFIDILRYAVVDFAYEDLAIVKAVRRSDPNRLVLWRSSRLQPESILYRRVRKRILEVRRTRTVTPVAMHVRL